MSKGAHPSVSSSKNRAAPVFKSHGKERPRDRLWNERLLHRKWGGARLWLSSSNGRPQRRKAHALQHALGFVGAVAELSAIEFFIAEIIAQISSLREKMPIDSGILADPNNRILQAAHNPVNIALACFPRSN
jgi:hypothetical protein